VVDGGVERGGGKGGGGGSCHTTNTPHQHVTSVEPRVCHARVKHRAKTRTLARRHARRRVGKACAGRSSREITRSTFRCCSVPRHRAPPQGEHAISRCVSSVTPFVARGRPPSYRRASHDRSRVLKYINCRPPPLRMNPSQSRPSDQRKAQLSTKALFGQEAHEVLRLVGYIDRHCGICPRTANACATRGQPPP
jgi:hypothetical protein